MREPQRKVKTCWWSSLHFGGEARDENSRSSYFQTLLLLFFVSIRLSTMLRYD